MTYCDTIDSEEFLMASQAEQDSESKLTPKGRNLQVVWAASHCWGAISESAF